VPDLYALDSILPDHLRENTQFINWIEEYLEWQQSTANSPAFIINKLNEIRDIDRVEEIFIQYLQNEYAIGIPNVAKTDKRKLYKQVNDIYRSKGSTPSYEALFNLLFNESIELYFPRVDLLKPSEGKWNNDSKRYLNNNGFLSDRKYIQDSYYYQDFSYVIKTGQTIETWRDTVKKLLHPSGFAFFGQINIVSTSLVSTVKSPHFQPGSAAGKPEAFPLIADLVTFPSATRSFTKFRTIKRVCPTINYFGGTYVWLEQTKFTNEKPISQYSDLTIEIAGSTEHTNRMPGSQIAIS
jgi:hypothetical protein